MFLKRLSSSFLALALLVTALVPSQSAYARCGGGGGHMSSPCGGRPCGGRPMASPCGGGRPCGGQRMGRPCGGGGCGSFRMSFMARPMAYGAFGRYPLVGFRSPIRRSFGLPGFSPIRQFAFGRGRIRREMRRDFLTA